MATNQVTGQNYTGTYQTSMTFTLTELTVNGVVTVQVVLTAADNLIPNEVDVWYVNVLFSLCTVLCSPFNIQFLLSGE